MTRRKLFAMFAAAVGWRGRDGVHLGRKIRINSKGLMAKADFSNLVEDVMDRHLYGYYTPLVKK